MPPILQIVCQREPNDCAIAAIATYLGASYEDVLRASMLVDKRGARGVRYISQIKTIAAGFGVTLKARRKINLDEDEGLLRVILKKSRDAHIVVLKRGLIFDTNGRVWDHEVYLATASARPTTLLTLEGERNEQF